MSPTRRIAVLALAGLLGLATLAGVATTAGATDPAARLRDAQRAIDQLATRYFVATQEVQTINHELATIDARIRFAAS